MTTRSGIDEAWLGVTIDELVDSVTWYDRRIEAARGDALLVGVLEGQRTEELEQLLVVLEAASDADVFIEDLARKLERVLAHGVPAATLARLDGLHLADLEVPPSTIRARLLEAAARSKSAA